MSTRIIGLIVLPIAAAGLAWELNKTRLSMATSKWKKVPCVVSGIESVLESSPLSEDETFAVHANYTYEVDGKPLSSTKISNSHCKFLSRKEADRLTSGIPQSGPYHAYYNPKNPQDSVLVTGHDFTNLKEVAIWILAIPFAIFLIFKG